MTESKYKIIPINQPVNTDQEDEGEDDDDEFNENLDDDTVTIVPTNDTDELHFSYKLNENNIMYTPTGILSLILIYFTLSIGLTFYQRNLLKVFIQFFFLYFFSFTWIVISKHEIVRYFFGFNHGLIIFGV